MADLSWLRLGQRSRTPNTPRSPTSSDRAPIRESQGGEHRRSGPSRVSSYLSLTSPKSFSPEPLTARNHDSHLVRDQDKVWYNPSLDQMVESLQVVIMTQGVLQPIPVEYNTNILHLIEGFADAQEKIRTADAAYVEAKQSLEQNLDQFRQVADEWLEREAKYKTEIKRLEVLLSRTSQDGLEAVTLARTHSVVDRSGPEAKEFVSRLRQLVKPDKQDPPMNVRWKAGQWDSKSGDGAKQPEVPVSLPKILDKDNDFLMSEKIGRLEAASKASEPHVRRRRQHRRAHTTRKQSNDKLVDAWREAPLSTRAGARESSPLFSDDMADSPDTSSDPEASPDKSTHVWRHVRRQMLDGLLDRPEPNIDDLPLPGRDHPRPTSHSISIDREGQRSYGEVHATFDDPTSLDRSLRRQRGLSGFSFVPGDDFSPVLTSREAAAWTGKGEPCREPDDGIELRRYEQDTQGTTNNSMGGSHPRRSRSGTRLEADLAHRPHEDRSPPSAEKVRLGVHDSTSSVNTVVRGSQGRPVIASHDSASSRHTMMRTWPSQSSPGVESGSASAAGRGTPWKQHADDSARIAAARALAQSSGSREHSKNSSGLPPTQ